METLREKHSRTGSANGGRFATHQHDEAETTLATVTVEIANGGPPQTLTPGVLDYEAQDTLSSGRCVAFAVAVAEHLNVDTISVLVDTDGSERVAHAWVENPSEPDTMIDSYGRRNIDDYYDEFCRNRREGCGECDGCEDLWECQDPTDGSTGLEIRYIPVAEMRQIESAPLGRGLPKQSWGDVRSFVQPALELD
jgi:hypothetical protein